VVRHISDRVAVMYLGRIVELTKSKLLYSHPFHPYTEALLSAAPPSHPAKKKERIILEGDVPSPRNVPAGCSFHPRCMYRQNTCSREIPALEEIEPDRWVACYYPRNN
jgi:oligopeptide/dipeptide ABC transporter ATP-binding protein